MSTGFIESGYSEYDYNYDELFGATTSALPNEYNCLNFCDLKPEDQGQTMMCVTYALSKALEYNYKTEQGIDVYIDKNVAYNARTNDGEGMTYRDALSWSKKNSYIKSYGRLYGATPMMKSIFVNGPCLIALPVNDSSRTDFWNGNKNEGGHAVCVVGYNEEGFIIMNSWGSMYGNNGTSVLPFESFGKVLEAWALII